MRFHLPAKIHKAVAILLYLDQQQDLMVPVHWEYIGYVVDMPRCQLLPMMSRLVTAKIVRSMAKSEGGYHLARRASNITLLEVVEALEGPITASVGEYEECDPNTARKLLSHRS